jgi:hypothetical protein
MNPEKSPAKAALWTVALFFLGFSLFINLPAVHNGFLSADQAVYYAMAQSIAYDNDLEYTKKDLIRYYEDFGAGPNGIFLKKAPDGKLYYAKSFAYALFAAPFVRVFGTNGPLVFHSLLLFLLLLMGFSYFSISNSPGLSMLQVLTFLFASIAGIYFLWISPDFFNLFLVFTALFLWLYKIRRKEAPSPVSEVKKGRFQAFLLSESSDYLAAFLAGIAVFSKPPNVALMGPLVLWCLIKKNFIKTAAMILLFALSAGLFFGMNARFTSSGWNFQGGERKTFYFNFPYEKEDVTFDNAPNSNTMTSEGYFGRFLYPFKFIFYNIFYYFFGRFTGIAWYFFPAFLFLILFFLGKKSLDRWLILIALAGEILIYIVLMPDNYGGGGGSLANRYFLNIYPLFLFLPRIKIKHKEIILSWVAASIFIGQILINPFQSSSSPSLFCKKFPFTLLPVEMTLINNIPTTTNPDARRLQWGTPLFDDRFLYFLNDNFWKKQPNENGWWTMGDRKADIILKTYFPVKELVFRVLNNPRRANEISVSVDGHVQRITLGSKEWGTLRFPVGNEFKIKHLHYHRLKIKAAKGAIPFFEIDSSREKRFLGVFFELDVIPRQ